MAKNQQRVACKVVDPLSLGRRCYNASATHLYRSLDPDVTEHLITTSRSRSETKDLYTVLRGSIRVPFGEVTFPDLNPLDPMLRDLALDIRVRERYTIMRGWKSRKRSSLTFEHIRPWPRGNRAGDSCLNYHFAYSYTCTYIRCVITREKRAGGGNIKLFGPLDGSWTCTRISRVECTWPTLPVSYSPWVMASSRPFFYLHAPPFWQPMTELC